MMPCSSRGITAGGAEMNSLSSIGGSTGVIAPAADSGDGGSTAGAVGAGEEGRAVSRRSCALSNFEEVGEATLIAVRRLACTALVVRDLSAILERARRIIIELRLNLNAKCIFFPNPQRRERESMSKNGLTKEDTAQEFPLQAIVLCDPWGEEFRWGPLVRPLHDDDDDSTTPPAEPRPWVSHCTIAQPDWAKTDDKRQCLLPMLNVPLLAWTLESLVTAGVQEVLIFASNGVEQIRSWINDSTYNSKFSTLSIIIRPTTAATPGDVLREVDSLVILAPKDFLVVQAGYVGNIQLDEKVIEFAERRKLDPSLAMSCVVASKKLAYVIIPIPRHQRLTRRNDRTTSKYAVHLLAPNHQLLHYEECSLFPKKKRSVLPREALDEGKEAVVRADLESVGVTICSVEVRLSCLCDTATTDTMRGCRYRRSLRRTLIINTFTPISSTGFSRRTFSARRFAVRSWERTSRRPTRFARLSSTPLSWGTRERTM